MPAFRKPRPLWHLLVMLGCAIIAPLLLFGVFAGIRITDTQLREVQNELMSRARTLSAGFDREIVGEIKRLRALAASSSLHQGDLTEFQRQAEASLASRQADNIALVGRDMQELVNTWVPFGTPLAKAAVPTIEPIERALATGQPQATSVFIGSVTKRLMFGVIIPVQVDGENRYVLVGFPDPHVLASLIAASELPAGWQAAVSDTMHSIIVASDQDTVMGKELPRAQWHRTGSGGVSEFVDSEGQRSLEAHTWSELTGWETAVWAHTALLHAPVRALWRMIGLTALTTFALVVAFASWLGRIIARSVGEAAAAAIALGEGNPVALSATPVAEVDTLMAELGRTAAKREAAEDLLRQSKDRLELAMDAAQLGSWRYDPLTRVVSGDGRYQEILEASNNEALIDELLQPVHPDDVERLWGAIKVALDPVDPKRSAAEFRLRRRSGEVRWVEILGLAYFGGAGRERRAVSLVGTAQDITERKEHSVDTDWRPGIGTVPLRDVAEHRKIGKHHRV